MIRLTPRQILELAYTFEVEGIYSINYKDYLTEVEKKRYDEMDKTDRSIWERQQLIRAYKELIKLHETAIDILNDLKEK